MAVTGFPLHPNEPLMIMGLAIILHTYYITYIDFDQIVGHYCIMVTVAVLIRQ